MSDTPILPGARAAFVNPDGTPSRPFYDYLRRQSLASNIGSDSTAQLSADVVTIARKLGSSDGTTANIPASLLTFQGFSSLFASQTGNVISLSLTGDVNQPGNTYFYGTSTTGSKGWRTIYSALAHTSDTTLSAGTDGTVTIGLADLANSGTGAALVKITRDAKGRVSGTSAATTSDLTEGSNLYFTSARVLTTALTGLSTSTSTAVTASDSVLLGMGKLQAQATANATALAGKEPAITAGTTAQYWRGDKTWQDLAAAVRTVVLTGLSTATSAVISATDTVLGALGKLQAQITDNLIPKGYIDGLQMQWVSGTALTVSTGAAYIEGSGKVLRATSAIAKSGLSLTASTWYHVYLYSNAGTPDIELSTTAPASPYSGTARSKTGDASRRYLGSVQTDAIGNIFSFIVNGNLVSYREDVANGVFRLLSSGTSTTEASVSCTGVIPATANIGLLNFINTATSGGVIRSGVSDDNFSAPGAKGIAYVRAQSAALLTHPLDSSQAFTYWFDAAPSGGGAYINALGYFYER